MFLIPVPSASLLVHEWTSRARACARGCSRASLAPQHEQRRPEEHRSLSGTNGGGRRLRVARGVFVSTYMYLLQISVPSLAPDSRRLTSYSDRKHIAAPDKCKFFFSLSCRLIELCSNSVHSYIALK